VTVTYRNDLDKPEADRLKVTPKQAKAHAKALHRKLEGFYGPLPTIWKLEPHKSGVPHLHLLVLMPQTWQPDLQGERDRFALAWCQVSGQVDADGKPDPKVYAVHAFGKGDDASGYSKRAAWSKLNDWRQTTSYASKYLGKPVVGEDWETPGRWWGVYRRELLPVEISETTLEHQTAVELCRLCRRKANAQARSKGFQLLIQQADGRYTPPSGKSIFKHPTFQQRKQFRIENKSVLRLRKPRSWFNRMGGGRLYQSENLSISMYLMAEAIARSKLHANATCAPF
jgi:hypothetical protein